METKQTGGHGHQPPPACQFPNHTSLLQECLDVISEVAEASLATWSAKDPRQIEEELADTFARFARIANTLGVPLEGIIV